MCHLHERTLISQIFYVSPKFWAIFDVFNTNVWDCIQLDVISIFTHENQAIISMHMLFGVNSFLNLFSLAYYMYFQYFQISFLCPRIKWPGAYCFCPVCLLSTLTFAIIFLTICDRDFIWHAYSTNKALSYDWHSLWKKNLFRTLLPPGAQCFRMCAQFAIFPKISNFCTI